MSTLIGLSLDEYQEELQSKQRRVVKTASGNLWVGAERRAIIRLPVFDDTPVDTSEVHGALRTSRAAVASYLCPPTSQRPTNAWLYICQDRQYHLSKLTKNARRDVRRALRDLKIEPIDSTTVLKNGFQAYKDTRERIGLDDSSYDDFHSRLDRFTQIRAHQLLGAWKGNKLIAFTTLVIVENWVEIEGSFSTNEDRVSCPNNGLIHYILEHFLVAREYKTVCYGLSTVQHNTSEHGLHFFKTRMNFEARPMHRAFVLHPGLSLLVNRLTFQGLELALPLLSTNRTLRKVHGMMARILNMT